MDLLLSGTTRALQLRVVALVSDYDLSRVARVLRWYETLGSGAIDLLDAGAVRDLSPAERTRLTEAPMDIRALLGRFGARMPTLFLGPKGARPHAWTFRGGEAYALVPAGARAAVIAHELGHLLFQWPDLPYGERDGVRCLMGRIPLPDEEDGIVPPCMALRVAAGWAVPEPLSAGTPPSQLAEQRAFAWAGLLIERWQNRLVAFELSHTTQGPLVALRRVITIPPDSSCALALVSRTTRARGGGLMCAVGQT
jgi:hypothetical protein